MTNTARPSNEPRCIDEPAALKEYARIGKSAAAGELFGAAFLELVVENVRLMLHPATLDKAREIYTKYREGKAAAMGRLTTDAGKESNFKQRSSDVFNIMKAAANPAINFADVLIEARPIIVQTKEDGKHKHNTWDAFIAIARAQLLAGDEQLAADEIEQALLPKTKTQKEKNEVNSLEAILKKLEKHHEEYPSERVENTVHTLREQIDLLK